MTARTDIFRADLSGTAFGGSPTWTDLSAYLLAEGQGEPVSITRYRQDEESDVTPSTMTVVVDNADGRFTPDLASGAYYPRMTPGFRANFRQTVNGTTYDRFDGYCTEIAQAWPGGSEGWSVVRLTFVDVTAKLAKALPLRSLLHYEMLVDSPVLMYPLQEPAGSTSAADVSGFNRAPATIVNAKDGAWPLVFGQDMGAFDTMTGVNQGATNTTSRASSLAIPLMPIQGSGGTMSFEIWFVAPDSVATGASPQLFTIYNYSKSKIITLFVNSPGGTLTFLANDGTNVALPSTTSSICDGGLHQAVCTIDADSQTCRLYLDGVQAAIDSAAAAFNWTGLAYHQLGGITVPFSGATWPKTFAMYAQYAGSGPLDSSDVLRHYQAGKGTKTERSDLRFARIAGYGGITTSGLPTGQATMSGQRTTGKTALDALKTVARTEGSVCYATGTGALTFQGRPARYQPAVAATLSTTNHDVSDDLAPRKDDQGLINDITISREGGASQRVQDQTSINQYGRSDPGGYTVACSTDDDAYQAAAWQVATHKDPSLRVPSVKVDLLTQPTTATTQAVLALDLSSVIKLTNLPSNAPASSMSLFVEGIRETIGLKSWDIEFFTSPITIEDDVLILDSATVGLEDTNRVAF